MKYIIYPTEQECQIRCDELTAGYKLLLPDDDIDVYARPIPGMNGFYIPIVNGAESLFTKSEIDSAVEYERLPEEDLIIDV